MSDTAHHVHWLVALTFAGTTFYRVIMSDFQRFSSRIRTRLLMCFNGIALTIVVATMIARLRGIDTMTVIWGVWWGIALGLWCASTLTVIFIRVGLPLLSKSLTDG